MKRMKRWMTVLDGKENVDPTDGRNERGKWKGRIRNVIKQLSQSMSREEGYRENPCVPADDAGPSDSTLPTIESGTVCNWSHFIFVHVSLVSSLFAGALISARLSSNTPMNMTLIILIAVTCGSIKKRLCQ